MSIHDHKSYWHCIQEDFIILEYDEVEKCWRFVTGIAALSFVELGINGEKSFMTPGASMASIHTPVPGFNPTIHDQVGDYSLTYGPTTGIQYPLCR